jgi:hypothetical protein
MFVIFKNGRPQGNKKFATYEKARQQARKWIRKEGSYAFISWKNFSSNPMLYDGGYTIRRVNG